MPASQPDLFESALPQASELEHRCWRRLQGHRGREQAISARTLSHLLGVSEREVRETIKALIEGYGCLIASTSSVPGGYFLPTSLEEVDEVYQSLRGRALSILARAAALRKVSVTQLLGQLVLELEEADHQRGISFRSAMERRPEQRRQGP